jgi:hypothetical protein
MAARAGIKILGALAGRNIALVIKTQRTEGKRRGFPGQALIIELSYWEKDYKLIKRGYKMKDLTRRLDDIGREEGRVFDVEKLEAERVERRRELRNHYWSGKFVQYVEKVLNKIGLYRAQF